MRLVRPDVQQPLRFSLDARRTSTLWECSIRLVYKTNCPSPLANWTKSTCIVSVDFVPARIPGQWLIDSGNHYTSARHILSSFRDILPVRILTGNGHVTALGSGVTLHTSLGTCLLTDHWYGILQIMRYLKGHDSVKLCLGNNKPPISNLSSNLFGYFDTSLMDCTASRRSTGGYIFFYYGSVISWKSKKQGMVALSTTEAE